MPKIITIKNFNRSKFIDGFIFTFNNVWFYFHHSFDSWTPIKDTLFDFWESSINILLGV